MSARQTTEPAEAETLRAEIGQDMRVLANYVAENVDPVAELREMFEAPDTAGLMGFAAAQPTGTGEARPSRIRP